MFGEVKKKVRRERGEEERCACGEELKRLDVE